LLRDVIVILIEFIFHRSCGVARHTTSAPQGKNGEILKKRRRAEWQFVNAKKGCPIWTALATFRSCKRRIRPLAQQVGLPPRQPAGRISHSPVGPG
jgi:hypothetical protein